MEYDIFAHDFSLSSTVVHRFLAFGECGESPHVANSTSVGNEIFWWCFDPITAVWTSTQHLIGVAEVLTVEVGVTCSHGEVDRDRGV